MKVTLRKGEGLDLRFTAPPSKSYTHRALIAGALAEGDTVLRSPLMAEDTRRTLAALRALGAGITESGGTLRIKGSGCRLPGGGPVTLDLGNSGTSLRLLASIALLAPREVTLDGSARMRERPVGPLADALAVLGGHARYLGETGYPPLTVWGTFRGGEVTVNGSISSQFASSLLLAGPCGAEDLVLRIDPPPVSASYLDVTAGLMQTFGAQVEREGSTRFRVPAGKGYRGIDYRVEGDYSSASYLMALAAVAGGRVTVDGLASCSVQGDRVFPSILAAMGCTVLVEDTSLTVERTGPLHGVDIDMSASPDTVMTVCAVAPFAASPTTIRGVSHLRYKESDRIRVMAGHLRSLGGKVETGKDWIRIFPAALRGGTLDPADDHRIAMAFAVIGIGAGGVTVDHAETVGKSFPGFWDQLKGAGLL
ncbi:MAG: 3-phosphoshikimate 1-carboxyvinyltransferase [Methanomicrobiales archaeon]|nr:3-phosphoshikimate 1-carboxyvinyltransferase [Methanomicrobiales archaeon]MDD1655322.1 3-phosphoshikimate 1-carboxyvinyltransferase [Methanomicrobiales archaeon]